MDKQAKSKVSLAFDISGFVLILVAIFIVKLANQPLVEILAGVLATIGFGLIAGAKYVWDNKRTGVDFIAWSSYFTYSLEEENINIFSSCLA